MTDAAPGSSCWRRADGAQPLRAWRKAQCVAVAGLLGRAWREWQQAWGLGTCDSTLVGTPFTSGDGEGAWTCLGARGGAAAWLQLAGSFDASLSRALWKLERTETPIATAVQAECRQDLVLRIATAAGVDQDAGDELLLPAPAAGWSGALRFDLPWEGRVLLNAQAVQALLKDTPSAGPKRPALVPIGTAVSGHAVALRIHLADCELDIGSLRELQRGDVLRLQHRLDTPLLVRDPAGRTLFSASLARRRQFKAVQLGPAPSGAPASSKVTP